MTTPAEVAVATISARGTTYDVVVPHARTDYIQGRLVATGEPYEAAMLDAVADLVLPGDLVIDVGANVGNHTLYMAAVCRCDVVAFEPNPELTEALVDSARRNGLDARVDVRQIALGDVPARGVFAEERPDNLGGQAVALTDGGGDFEVGVLDEQKLDRAVALVKLDVEGMELAVLEGATGLVARDRPHLFVECQDVEHFDQIAAWMTAHGYGYVATYNATPTHHFRPMDPAALAGNAVALGLVHDSYLTGENLRQTRETLHDAQRKYRSVTAAAARNTAGAAQQQEHDARAVKSGRLALERVRGEALRYRDERDAHAAMLVKTRQQGGRTRKELAETRKELSRVRKRLRRERREHRELERRRFVRVVRKLERGRDRLLRRDRATSTAATQTPEVRAAAPVTPPPRYAAWVDYASTRVHDTATLEARAAAAAASGAGLRSALGAGDRLRMAAVVDDFTRHSLGFDCDLLDVLPEGWQEQLEEFRPHLLFVESAWRGKQGSWHNTVPRLPEELQRILAWCRDHLVPTVFWNKEDPVHFHTFLRVAAEFDHVYTTDVDLVPRYAAALGHERIGFLPFACQPRTHNPVETRTRKDALAFAGGYYTRYPERMRDLRAIIDGASAVMPVEIFDRMLGTTLEPYAFPDEYQQYVVGTLAPDDLEVAYKGYRVALNLNSVKGSESMFARRAYELLASNTLTISNYARGLRVVLGDLVPMSDSRDETRRTLADLVAHPDKADRLRAMGVRKVLTEHTWEMRLRHLLADVTGVRELPRRRVVTTLSPVAEIDASRRVLRAVAAQEGLEVRPQFLTGDPATRQWLEEQGHIVHDAAAVGERCLAELLDDEASGIALLHPDDWHGPHHLHDLDLAWSYCDADVVGRAAYALAEGADARAVEGVEYQATTTLGLRGALLGPAVARMLSVAELVDAPSPLAPEGTTQFAIHRFDFCRDGALLPDDVTAPLEASLPDADPGMSLAEIHRCVEERPEDPGHGARKLAPVGGWRVRHGVDVTVSRGDIRVDSSLPPDEKAIVWSPERIDVDAVWPDGTARFGFLRHGDLAMDLALRFFDADGELLLAVTRAADANHEVPVPEGAVEAMVGFWLGGPGRAIVPAVLLDPWAFDPPVTLTRNHVLLLSDHYPSYADVYRNVFVHARVRGYREAGLGVDVFRLRPDVAGSHHEYEGLDVTTGSVPGLRKLLGSGQYTTVVVHFLNPAMWSVLREFRDRLRIVVWVHGAEIQPWKRRTFNHLGDEELERAKTASAARMAFWGEVIEDEAPGLHFVFVSRSLADEVAADLGWEMSPDRYSIVPNPIDTEIFAFTPKVPEQRHRILSVRPYASRKYANDLAVAAVLELSSQPWFEELEFRFIGDGPLFEETLEPLRGLPNVTIERRYLTHRQMAELYADYGVLLVPTRWDSHGVSRDEAMAAGLVPVTSAVAAVPEFVSEEEGVLAPYDDHHGLAAGIAMLHEEPETFLRMSAAAAARVRRQSASNDVVRQEIGLIRGDAGAVS